MARAKRRAVMASHSRETVDPPAPGERTAAQSERTSSSSPALPASVSMA